MECILRTPAIPHNLPDARCDMYFRIAAFLPPAMLRWMLVVMFFAIAAWTLVPEGDDDDETAAGPIAIAVDVHEAPTEGDAA